MCKLQELRKSHGSVSDSGLHPCVGKPRSFQPSGNLAKVQSLLISVPLVGCLACRLNSEKMSGPGRGSFLGRIRNMQHMMQ